MKLPTLFMHAGEEAAAVYLVLILIVVYNNTTGSGGIKEAADEVSAVGCRCCTRRGAR